ncbi:MAG: hypothetical protein MJ185_11845 [Treponema sp.]|nr:hypothetical protein [Treponema sp.]
MKKTIALITTLASCLLLYSCKPTVTPEQPDSDKKTQGSSTTQNSESTGTPKPDQEPPLDPDFAHPGNVETVSFTISDIPAEYTSVHIFRKYNTEKTYSHYATYDFYRTDESHTITFEDIFVEPGKTYNYKYTLIKNQSKPEYIYVDNGETKNFTPASGKGELKYNEPIPEFSYDPETTDLSFSTQLKIVPDPDSLYDAEKYENPDAPYPNVMSALCLDTDTFSWLTNTVDYTKTTLNLLNDFPYGQGDYNFSSFRPALFCSFPDSSYSLWFYGKEYSLEDENINIHFPVRFGAKNVENGIEVAFSKHKYDFTDWNNSYIEIYENDVKLDYKFFIYYNILYSTEIYKEHKFVFPFTTKGKTYTFKFNPNDEKSFEQSIVAEYTSSLKIDSQKITDNFKNMKISYIENNTAEKPVRLVKISSAAVDCFTGKTETNLRTGIELDVYADEGDWQGSINGMSQTAFNELTSDGLNILESEYFEHYGDVTKAFNETGKILFLPCLLFTVEDEANAAGNFFITGNLSETFPWAATE